MSLLNAEKATFPAETQQHAQSAFHASNEAERQPPQVKRRIHKWLSPFSLLRVLVLAAFVGSQIWHTDSLLSKGTTTVLNNLSQWRHHPHLLPELYSICARTGRHIYTSEEHNEWTQCVTVRNGTIVDVGDLRPVTSQQYTVSTKTDAMSAATSFGLYGDDHGQEARRHTIIENLKHQVFYLPEGSLMTPSAFAQRGTPPTIVFIDTFCLFYRACNTGGLNNYPSEVQLAWKPAFLPDVISKVEEYVKTHKKQIEQGRWAEGAGWDQNIWPVKSFPKASDFDKSPALKGVPIALKRIDIHAEWVSPAVLAMMGDLPAEVPGGQIIRDEEGKPTGVFVDDAMFLIDKVRPQWTEAQMQEYLNLTIQDGLSKGLVGIHDGGVIPEHVEFFQRYVCTPSEGELGLTVDLLGWARRVVYRDGALGSWGAALIKPYSDKPDVYGTMRSPEEVWGPLIKSFVRKGWQVNVHCIGDKANRIVLDAMQAALEELPEHERAGRRLRLEHAQIMQLEDLTRAAKLGTTILRYCIASSFNILPQMWYAEDRLGPERIQGAYAWRRYLQAGGKITLGSDFPVESIDPLKGFYAAVTRLDEDGNSPMGKDGWYPDQKLTREEALKGMTIYAAYASFMEKQTGSFSIGKQFDAVVWDQNILNVPQEDILRTKVLSTIIDGKAAWGRLFGNGPHPRQANTREYTYGRFPKTLF
ncbi:hypothetical protein QFC22_003601 [Naganishia vaughanmartiniae]|uniref:Uncharacterized protein n=1 Tax=Naganishia vaughanmartiniae TaxID=1424756 RepID=A0ACC2X514_9TREE|nr:hypothetical protein QFC22_003601 [Naganishia vaughanmartiniae]